jgi:hypothetical protein
MVKSLTVTMGWLAVGCFLFATTYGQSLALIAVLADVFEHFQRAGLKVLIMLMLQPQLLKRYLTGGQTTLQLLNSSRRCRSLHLLL